MFLLMQLEDNNYTQSNETNHPERQYYFKQALHFEMTV